MFNKNDGSNEHDTKGLCALPRLSEIPFRQSTEAEAWLRLMFWNCMMKPADAIFIVTQTGFVRRSSHQCWRRNKCSRFGCV